MSISFTTMKDLKYLLAYSIPLSAYFALQWQGWWSWSTVILAFGIFPILDALYPTSIENHSDNEEKKRLSNKFFDILLYICAPICFVLIFLYFHTITNSSLSINETAGLTFSIGVVLGSLVAFATSGSLTYLNGRGHGSAGAGGLSKSGGGTSDGGFGTGGIITVIEYITE